MSSFSGGAVRTASPRRWPTRARGFWRELRKVIVGQDEVVDQVLMALFTGGHCLLIGVPGLAKTLLVKHARARSWTCSFKRIQFTPDLMPADITGTEILEEDQTACAALRFVQGPIFANIILADEINRTPPKTQAALLEAMQEHHVTAGGQHLPARRGRSSCSPRRTRSSRKAPIRCPKRSSTASCSTSS